MPLAEFVYTTILRPKPLRKMADTVIRSLIPAQLKVGDSVVVLNQNDPVVCGALSLGVYEKAETRFFRSVCKPGMTFLDIGANIGYYSALALGLIGNGRIIALEPDQENFKYLEKTVAANHAKNVTCVRKAAATENKIVTLYTSSSNRGDNRLYPNELCEGSAQVETCTIDSLLKELKVPSVDLVKIDVQGFEGHVIQGMKETLTNSEHVTLLSEFWPFGLESAGSRSEEFLTGLERLGLELYELTRKGTLLRLTDKKRFIRRFPGRRYTNIVGFRGDAAWHIRNSA
jgi:FkbM family methyltransferase